MRRSAMPLVSGLVIAFILALLGSSLSAQVAGRNVNMVSGGTFPGGDPFLQKQNEPSIAVSTRNPCHLLAGANDYRAVDLKFPEANATGELGDAWLGWYESTDCGATWYSTLVPGYQQDTSPEGLASPVKGLTAGADPGLKSGAAGTFYYLFIAFNRGSNVGKLALARAIDHNDRDAFINADTIPDVNARRALSPIRYVGTTEIARGSSGQFIDKPSITVFPAGNGTTCVMDGETVPATNVYVAWTEFVGNSPENIRSKIYFARSLDCGRTVASFTKLSEGYALGQGTAVAVNPTNPNDIYVMWRQLRTSKNADAILFARSTDGGRSFTHAQPVPGLAEGQYLPFDQNTTSPLLNPDHKTLTFRTVGYPTLAFSDEAPNGQLYLAYASPLAGTPGQLGGTNSRIMIMRTDGMTWTAPVQAVPTSEDGQQIMPAMTYAAGKLQLTWYDFRFDESGLKASNLVDELEALSKTPKIRHTVDLLGAQAILPVSNWPPVPGTFFQHYGVSQPDLNDFPATRGPRISQYVIGDPNPLVDEGGPRQLNFNFSGITAYGGGRIAFLGDYNDIAGTPFVLNAAGQWVFNGLQAKDANGVLNKDNIAYGTFHAVWTDNRDMRLGQGDGVNAILGYTPPSLPQCNPDNTRTRDANVYTSRITQDFSFTAATNTKRTNAGVVRAFAVNLANGTDADSTFQLVLTDQNASFSRATFGNGICPVSNPGVPLHTITVNVAKQSSIARTVYVNCTTSLLHQVVVTATRTLHDGEPSTEKASVVLNADPSNPPTKDGSSGDGLGFETHTPDPENPDPENPGGQTPDPENPDPENKDAPNPDPENVGSETPDPENPDPENVDPHNPDPENPDPENPDPENANFQDVSIDLTNSGNTTSGYQVHVQADNSSPLSSYQFVFMARRLYGTPTAVGCTLGTYLRNQILFSTFYDPQDLTRPDFLPENDSSIKNATVLVRPGETIRVTLRVVWSDDPATTNDDNAPGPFCSPDPDASNACFKKLLFRTKALAPNTGETEPDEASVGSLPGPDLIVTDGPISVAPPPVAGLGGFVDITPVTIRNQGTEVTGEDGFEWATFVRSNITGRVDSASFNSSPLDPGEEVSTGPLRLQIPFTNFSGETQVTLPAGTNYRVGVFADSGFPNVDESNETNNSLESASPIEVVSYTADINVTDGAVDPGTPFPVDVLVTESDFDPVGGATVTLSLEGPNPEPNVPGDSAPVTVSPPSDTTDGTGTASFMVTVNLPEGITSAQYRLIATVTLPGGTTMIKFQSHNFTVSEPEP